MVTLIRTESVSTWSGPIESHPDRQYEAVRIMRRALADPVDINGQHLPLQRIDCPVIGLQALNNRVVSRSSMRWRLPHSIIVGFPNAGPPFEGEGHVVRNAVKIDWSDDAKLHVFGRSVEV
jgi:hypothetical protein